jgi:tellurite resistance protein TerC
MFMQYALWIGFFILILGLLLLDLVVLQRRQHEIKLREAFVWVAFWVSLALAFDAGLYFYKGSRNAMEFLTGYLIEYSLSVDNIFVFIMIFGFFNVPPQYRHKVLFWGILGAVVMRGIFIFTGIALIEKLHWVIYVFGAFLVYIGVRMALHQEQEVHPDKNIVIRAFRRIMPVSKGYVGGRFFTTEAGKLIATPLFVVVLAIETTDVIFAVDSIPAILAITLDRFIVYTSNIFAILGLRALYFAMAGIMPLFHYLKYGLSAILVFVGVKMLIADFFKIPVAAALGVVAGLLLVSIIASLAFPSKGGKEEPRLGTGTPGAD